MSWGAGYRRRLRSQDGVVGVVCAGGCGSGSWADFVDHVGPVVVEEPGDLVGLVVVAGVEALRRGISSAGSWLTKSRVPPGATASSRPRSAELPGWCESGKYWTEIRSNAPTGGGVMVRSARAHATLPVTSVAAAARCRAVREMSTRRRARRLGPARVRRRLPRIPRQVLALALSQPQPDLQRPPQRTARH